MKRMISSVLEMREFAKDTAGTLQGGEVLGLEGELGTGKTEFARGLAEALGSKDAVKSPSFTLLNHYRLEHSTIKHLIHVDLYRLEDAGANLVSQIGLDEWLGRLDAVIVIEWPKRLRQSLPEMRCFSFSYGSSENEREVNFK